MILSDAIQRAVVTLADFKSKIDGVGVQKIIVTATSAVRSASNQKEFIDLIEAKTKLKINVLSGDQEALLIHKGVREYIYFGKDTGLIMDIGGGSIEFIIADKNEVKWLRSYELGGQRLMDQFHQRDPILQNDRLKLKHFLVEQLKEVFMASRKYKASFLIGSSGSFDTFWDMKVGKSNFKSTLKPVLQRSDFDSIYYNLIEKNRTERLQIAGMIPMRVDMIVSASVVVKTVMDSCGFEQIKISPFALKEGILHHGLPKQK